MPAGGNARQCTNTFCAKMNGLPERRIAEDQNALPLGPSPMVRRDEGGPNGEQDHPADKHDRMKTIGQRNGTMGPSHRGVSRTPATVTSAIASAR